MPGYRTVYFYPDAGLSILAWIPDCLFLPGYRTVYLPGRRTGNLFLLMFRLQKAGCSKHSASRFWQRTDRCLMPWPFWQALCSGSGRHLLGLQSFFMRQTMCPKSCVSGRILRTSSFSPESHQKEQIPCPAGCGCLNVRMPGFDAYLENGTRIHRFSQGQPLEI